MKFNIDPKLLRDELSFLSLAVDKSGVEITSNVLIETKGKTAIIVKATNIHTSIQAEIEADVKDEGTACLNGVKFHAVMKVLAEEATFKTEPNDWISVKAGSSKFKIPGVDSNKFPEIAIMDKAILKIKSESIAKAMKATSFATSEEPSRFTISGVNLEAEGKEAKFVATDGHRIAKMVTVCGTADKDPIQMLIPKECFLELTKLPKGKVVEVGQDSNHIFFKVDNKFITSRKLTGNFPNYQPMFNEDGNVTATVGKDDLKNAITRVSVMSDKKIPTVDCTFTKGKLSFFAQTAEMGESEDEIAIKYSGDDVKVRINWAYLADFLNNCDEETLVLSFKDSSKPILVTYESYKYALMPLRVS